MSYTKKLLKYLLISIFTIFILISISTLLYEFTHLEKHVQDKAIHTSKLIANQYLSRNMNSISMNQKNRDTTSKDFFKDHNFLFFKLSIKKRTPIITYESKEYKKIQSNINKHKHSLDIHNREDIKITIIHNHLYNTYYINALIAWEFKDGSIGELHTFYDASTDIKNIYIEWINEIIKVAIICLLILLAIYPIILLLQKDLLQKNQKLSQTNIEILEILGNAIAQRDSDTNSHNYRVTLYSILLAEALKLSNSQIKDIIQGAFLHDIGKIGVSDTILLKQGKLTEEEFEEMKKHVTKGADIVKDCTLLKPAIDIILYHHENYNGTGYFRGLNQDEIPLSARIFSIADVFDALTSKRPYKNAFSYEKTKEIMLKESAIQFDPKLLILFFEIVPSFYEDICINNTEKFLKEFLQKKILEYY